MMRAAMELEVVAPALPMIIAKRHKELGDALLIPAAGAVVTPGWASPGQLVGVGLGLGDQRSVMPARPAAATTVLAIAASSLFAEHAGRDCSSWSPGAPETETSGLSALTA